VFRRGPPRITPVRARLIGIALFLPVPLVLFLFTRAPLGVPASLGIGTLIMLTHRLYARPFAVAGAPRRCLWCGGAAAGGPQLTIRDPLGTVAWSACTENHRARAAGVALWAADHALFLRVGILGALVVFLAGDLLAARHLLGAVTPQDAVAFFRTAVAVTVLPLGILGARPRPVPMDGELRAPFPIHIQALLGTHAVVWLFRVIGLAWLGLGVAHIIPGGAW